MRPHKWMHSPLSFGGRRAIWEEGYTETVRMLADPASAIRLALQPQLPRELNQATHDVVIEFVELSVYGR